MSTNLTTLLLATLFTTLNMKVKVKVTQSYPTLCDPTDYTLPGSSVHEIPQAGIVEWVAVLFSRGSS